MQEIPDTGGGLSGFIAWLLWQVYQYFPSQGRWDWLVLFVFLAVVTRSLALPSSWKLAQWLTSQGRVPDERIPAVYLHNLFAQTGVMFLFVWFFSTDAGHTFLAGRTWFGNVSLLQASQSLWISGALFFVTGSVFFVGSVVLTAALGLPDSDELPFVFCFSSAVHAMAVVGAHVFYWHWSVASLILMWLFTAADWVAVIALVLWIARRFKQGKT